MRIAKIIYRDLRHYLTQLRVRADLARRQVSLGRGARIERPEPLRLRLNGRLVVADGTVLLACEEEGGMDNWGYEFGDVVYIGENCNLRASGCIISVGTHTMIATGCILIGSNHSMALDTPMRLQPSAKDRLGIIIEEGVWVGAGSIILPGTHIERGAVIAAGAVVRGLVPAETIFGGVPARQIGIRGV